MSLLLPQRETFGNLLSLGYCENKDLSTSKTYLSPIYNKLFLFYTSNIGRKKKIEHKTASAWMLEFYIYNKPYQLLNSCINAFEKWSCWCSDKELSFSLFSNTRNKNTIFRGFLRLVRPILMYGVKTWIFNPENLGLSISFNSVGLVLGGQQPCQGKPHFLSVLACWARQACATSSILGASMRTMG